jgi:hypothetical protein
MNEEKRKQLIEIMERLRELNKQPIWTKLTYEEVCALLAKRREIIDELT